MALVDRLLGEPETMDGPSLARGVRRGSEGFAVRCVRSLGERDEEPAVDFLVPLLADPRAAVRRSAAASLGHLGRLRALPALQAAWAGETTEEGRLTLAVARVRCGEPVADVHAPLDAFERRELQTWQGARGPQAATGAPPLVVRFWQCLGEPPAGSTEHRGAVELQPRGALHAARLAGVEHARPGDDIRDRIHGLALLRHPHDQPVLARLLTTAGRREEHALLTALGLNGDPRSIPAIEDALFATDVDPGRGFAQRRLAATALGCIGLQSSVRTVLQALSNEAADYEGRPGAGMGVQFPVRTNLLWALGEIGSVEAAATLLPYLGNTHGSAFGGFYLPAMDALTKLGRAAVPAIRAYIPAAPEVAAANAVGVLVALREDVSAWRDDRRAAVARVARTAGAR